eukprot:TRINITY_DN7439_c0_g1_i9.p1 TRINITY_DN7439_c0_g1~~TRINITY_DN7439_c0_g1_i9.p1  ORF type:complete len:581 (-),score=72.32 TRINITY_DN7439_c0_g1_i9:99-1841(-)
MRIRAKGLHSKIQQLKQTERFSLLSTPALSLIDLQSNRSTIPSNTPSATARKSNSKPANEKTLSTARSIVNQRLARALKRDSSALLSSKPANKIPKQINQSCVAGLFTKGNSKVNPFSCTQKLNLKRKLGLGIVTKDHIDLNKSQRIRRNTRELLSPRCEESLMQEVVNPLPSELASQAYLLPESPKDICSRLLIMGEEIGRGTYAVVRSAYHRQLEKVVAVKIYDKSDTRIIQRKSLIQNEVEVLKQLHSPYIVKLHEVLETKSQVMLAMENVKGQNLHDYIRGAVDKSEREVKRLFRQVVAGIAYCHSKFIAHRDVKLENILVDERGDVRIIDFGFGTLIPSGEKMHCGTLLYMAPEILSHKEYASLSADIWALGVLLYTMLHNKFPFKAAAEEELLCRIFTDTLDFPGNTSIQARELVNRMLQVDPSKRPKAEDILRDAWLNTSSREIENEKRQYGNNYVIKNISPKKPRVQYSPPKKSILNNPKHSRRNVVRELARRRVLKYSIDHKLAENSSELLNATVQQRHNGLSFYKPAKECKRNTNNINPTISQKCIKNSRTGSKLGLLTGNKKACELYNH